MSKEKTENEKRVENATASDGAHIAELDLDEKDRNESVAGSLKDAKEAKEVKEVTKK